MDNLTHHIIEIPEKGILKYIPKELAFCNNDEFRDVAQLLFSWQMGSISYHEFRVQAIYALLNLKPGKRKINQLELENAFSNIERISYLMDSFFIETKDQNRQIKLNLIENPVPKIKPALLNISGPKARFTNTTFGQYEDASHAYQMFYRTSDVKYLWNLMAIYYQEPQRHQTKSIEKKAVYYKKYVDPALAYAFFLFFDAFQNYVTSSKVIWESKQIDLSILFKSDSSIKSDLPGLGTKSLAFHISKSGIMGNLEHTRKQPLWEVLLLLYDLRKTELDEAKAIKANKKNEA